jgi:hypothetical protein
MISSSAGGDTLPEDEEWKLFEYISRGIGALAAILEKGLGIKIHWFLWILRPVIGFLGGCLDFWEKYRKIQEAQISEEVKAMLTAYAAMTSIYKFFLFLVGLAGPWGIAIAFLVSMYVVILDLAFNLILNWAEYWENFNYLEYG